MLLYANMAIDAVQSSKKSWISTFVKDESISTPLTQFVDTQTAFVKQIAKTAHDISNAVAETVSTKMFSK